jgi:hypothetical protein
MPGWRPRGCSPRLTLSRRDGDYSAMSVLCQFACRGKVVRVLHPDGYGGTLARYTIRFPLFAYHAIGPVSVITITVSPIGLPLVWQDAPVKVRDSGSIPDLVW